MLEAALVFEFHKHVGCRNQRGTGGDGALNRKDPSPPPYFVYVTGGRADQMRRAPCKHLVELARAEVARNVAASRTLRAFAQVRLKDAEAGLHKVLVDNGYSAPVTVDEIDLGEPKYRRFPFIKLSSWAQHLLDTNRLPKQFVGVKSLEKMQPVLVEYWRRFKQLRPNHRVFELEAAGTISLSNCIPYYSHSDEGRSFKHLPIWILSSHGALGRGTRFYLASGKHRAPLRRNGMGLNFVGKTWSTNYIFTAAMKVVLVDVPDALDKLVAAFASDAQMLLETGLLSRDGQTRVWLAHIGTKGDLPALVKLGGMKRSFSNVPRGPSSKRACRGICHACMAGQELDANQGRAAVPFEDFSPNAAWVSTRFQELPWDVTPPIVQGLHLSEEDQTSFFNIDLWHNCHMGICKHFCASSFIGILESDLDAVPRVGMEAKFQWITQIYLNYFKSRRVNPFVREISRDTMNFPAGTACPIGKWSKGQASTEMMMFLHFFCRQYIEGNTADPLLLTIADAARALNLALSTLYRSGYWLQKEKAALLAKLMFRFLALYAKCAELTLRQGKRRFAMVPKLHMLAHAAFDLQDQSSRAEWAHNPLAMTNQIQEDFIGRPSRISRRVNIRSLHKSLIMRTLIVYQDSWRVADSDERGMDGYPDV
ncbi:unnamed protein product [Durusdinium trenchii]|uniref:Uncharacterized protein n=1 Tax=Durusdinium trenchii TaxID=1381693 RepID=A0ABP0HY42_9DINO